MPPKPKTEAERQQFRTLIIDAARELFVTLGYESVTMREIAKRIGYSATSIYLHFEDKESLLLAVCDTDMLALAASLQEIMQITDPVERMKVLGLGYAEFALTHPNQYRMLFMTPREPCDPEISTVKQNSAEQDAYFQLKTVVGDVYLAGKFKPEYKDPELIAQTIWAGMHGVCSLQIIMSKDSWVNWRDIELRIRTMQDIMMQGLIKE
jgi:AcrR family transcriptional regulator